jgi:hypothetical protein
MSLKRMQINMEDSRVSFEEVNILFILCKEFHTVQQAIVTCIMILNNIIYLHYLLSIPIMG